MTQVGSGSFPRAGGAGILYTYVSCELQVLGHIVHAAAGTWDWAGRGANGRDTLSTT